jgi:hypothetical protein
MQWVGAMVATISKLSNAEAGKKPTSLGVQAPIEQSFELFQNFKISYLPAFEPKMQVTKFIEDLCKRGHEVDPQETRITLFFFAQSR